MKVASVYFGILLVASFPSFSLSAFLREHNNELVVETANEDEGSSRNLQDKCTSIGTYDHPDRLRMLKIASFGCLPTRILLYLPFPPSLSLSSNSRSAPQKPKQKTTTRRLHLFGTISHGIL